MKMLLVLSFFLSFSAFANKVELVFKDITIMNQVDMEKRLKKVEVEIKKWLQNEEMCSSPYVKSLVHIKSPVIDFRNYSIVAYSPSCPNLKTLTIDMTDFNSVFSKNKDSFVLIGDKGVKRRIFIK